jgi:subtilase family serine protease
MQRRLAPIIVLVAAVVSSLAVEAPSGASRASQTTILAGPRGPGPAKVPAGNSDGKQHPPHKVRQSTGPDMMKHPLELEVFAYDATGLPLVTTTGSPSGYFPAVIKKLLGLTGDGTNQTIAIVTAFDAPNIVSDLTTFDTIFGLPAPVSFKKVSQAGSTTALPTPDAGWALEASLDVEWAHAIAPKAKLLLVEAKSAGFADMMAALSYASKQTGVSVISNSWGAPEFSTQTTFDSYCKLAKAVCVFASGDNGNPGSYGASNPYALAVGGTTLNLSIDASANVIVNSEVAWSGSGGGVSLYEARPSYQTSVNPNAKRAFPDVSYDADPSTGFPVYDSYPYNGQSGWYQMGGTSVGAPQWAAIIAVVNQLRVAAKKAVLAAQPTTGVYKAHSAIYGLTTGLADIVSGTNGACGVICSAATGFDFVTGKGSPRQGIEAALKAVA